MSRPGSRPATIGREAIVVGGGIGGLAAARVLSDLFERVTVLERDAPAEAHASRAGVPQGKHLHVLLAGGQRALDALLPGFTEDLDRVGAVRIQTGLDLLVERPGFDPFPRRDLGFYSSALSRPQLEFCVRRRVEAIENVRLEPGCRVFGLLPSEDGAAIRGLQFHREGRSETRATDLVVDASGTGELTLAALRATGRPAAPETVIGVDLGYSSAVFEIPAAASPGWKGVMHLSQAPQTSRSGLMMPVEGHRWMLALGGRHDEHPPGDEAGLRAYAASLRTSTIADAIGPARMIAGVDRFRFPESRLRHFERLESFPGGLLPLGDAICRFNPVFGQGMSVAALEAEALGQVLATASRDGGLGQAWRPFFQKVAEIVEAPWALAVVPDFVFPGTTGERPADFERSLLFGAALTRATARDADLHRLAGEVQHLLRPRHALMDPQVLAKVMREMAG
jgi:2-polyprenyl-6-methoxyphenol hydroxylase-like FAD-dependent oxidoreductase